MAGVHSQLDLFDYKPKPADVRLSNQGDSVLNISRQPGVDAWLQCDPLDLVGTPS
jgi:hypothetical protein